MSAVRLCQSCGNRLVDEGLELGICAACILRQGLLSSIQSMPTVIGHTIPPRQFGQYELLEEIGRGGMGVVYKARQQSLNRTVAIKLLVSGAYSSESLLHRFQTEAEAAASLQHPGIVAIYECGEHDNQPYYAMEYVDGQNLSEVSGGKPLAPVVAANHVRAIAEAVQYAHDRGILHRDLKPSNVLINADGRPRITDFGLAKRLHDNTDMTMAGQMLGSPNYAFPEQVAGRQQELGVRSDVYSLGALFYHLLTGRPPFLAGTMPETVRLVQETEPIPPRALNPDVPADLDTICLKCLEKDPERRYGTARELADELSRFLKGEPILARPISTLERGWRWCCRHPAPAGLAATIVLALTATSTVFYTSARQIELARAKEQSARLAAEENLYAANMQAISRSFLTVTGSDPRSLREKLEHSRPHPGEVDQRSFEWRYFWTQLQSDALAALRGHQHTIDSVHYSADGGRLATRSQDGVLKIWQVATRQELHSLVGVAAIGGFVSDGTQLIFSRENHSVWRLDLSTHEATLLLSPVGPLVGIVDDGRQAVVLDQDGLPVLQALNAATNPPAGLRRASEAVTALSRSGNRAAVAGRSRPGISVVEVATGRHLPVIADPRPVIGLAFSPDGRQLVTSSFDGVLKFWNTDTGLLLREQRVFLDPVWAMCYSPDGLQFAAAGNNREVKLWDAQTGREIETLHGHSSTVRSIAFAPDGRHLASGSEDEIVLLWPTRVARLPTEMPRLLRGPGYLDRTPSFNFSPDSQTFVGTAADGTVKVWRTDTTEVLATIPVEARTVAFSPDGRSVLTEEYGGQVQRWSIGGRQLDARGQTRALFANWQTDPLTPAERVALVADQAETRAECRLCEIPNARDGIFAGAIDSTPTIAMAPDGRTMFIGQPTGMVEVWDVNNQTRRFTFKAHKMSVTALAVSFDGRHLATGSLDNSTQLWEADTGRHLATFYEHNRPVWALAFSPDGRTLAAGSCDKEIILCSTTLRQHVASLPLYTGVPQGFEQEVRLMRFSPDGNILAAALGDGTLRFFRALPFTATDHSENSGAKP